jgi:hypothetical protein
LGPWVASCKYVQAEQGDIARSPMVALNLGKPVSGKLPPIASVPEIRDPSKISDAPSEDKSSLDRWCLGSAVLAITSLIVTLPDPITSHLVLDFDRRIDAIQAAALDAGYVIDQFWLPWEALDRPLPDDIEKAGKERALRQVRLSQPGLQIFRSKNSRSSALFVFLVGETPTLGVNLTQFESATNYVREVLKASSQTTTPETRILGPSFSGSIPALSEMLRRLIKQKACCFEIITSSATDHDLLSHLENAVRGAGTVQSVVHDDAAALERFLDYANATLKIRPEDVAIVSESQTAYGGSLGESDPNVPKVLRDRTLSLSFPREIYRLRVAYPDQQPLSAGTPRSGSMLDAGLALDLKLSPGGEDDIPYFSREQLPLSQEAIMRSIAETIHRREIKMVGVAASDVFDTLFVLRFLRQFCPDTRLFIVDSDLLFIRAADDLSLQGTLAVTDYPLSTLIQSWLGEKRRPRAFPSRNAEITYNAFLALIGHAESMRDYTPEAATSHGPEPLLWLTVVARNGFQPVHLLPPGTNEHVPLSFREGPSEKPKFTPDPPTGGYLFLTTLLILVTGTQLALAWFAAKPQTKFLDWALEFFHISAESTVRTQKAYLLATSLIVLTILDFIIFLPVWRITYFALRHGLASVWSVSLCVLSIAVVVGSIAEAAWLSSFYEVFQKKEGVWLALSWVIAACYYSVWFILTCRRGDDSVLFLHRSLDLSNGTSPLLPHLLLLICFYLWSLTNLRRVHLWETRRQTIAFTSLDRQYRSAFERLEGDLNDCFGNLFFSEYSWLIVILVLSALIFCRPFSHIAGFEPFLVGHWKVFDALYVVYLLLFTALLVASLIRFLVGWAALLKILRRLERQPIRHAFDRLPKKFYSWTPLWHSGGARRTYALQTRELECLRKLRSSGQVPPLPQNLQNDLPGLVNQLQASTWRLLDAEADCYLDLQPENEVWQENLISAADRIAEEFLIPRWLATGDCESFDHYKKEASAKPDQGIRHVIHNQLPVGDGHDIAVIAEEFVTLRFVAFLRYVGVQLRNLLSFVTAGFILCVASIRSYPFLAHHTIGWALTLMFVALGFPVVIAFAQMDKDALFSRLSDTDPGSLDSAFYVRLVSYGALPLLTVLASQFPAIGRFLFSWVQPAIEALH